MKFSLSWLKDHLATDADIQAVADTLNRIGLRWKALKTRQNGSRALPLPRC